MDILDLTVRTNNELFRIERNGEIVGECYGVKNSAKRIIEFNNPQDIVQNDILISKTNCKYHVLDIEYKEDLFYIKSSFVVYYKLEQTVSNINNSIIVSNSSNVTISNGISDKVLIEILKCKDQDKPLMLEMLAIIRDIEQNKIQPRKSLFERFLTTAEKYAPLFSIITTFISSLGNLIP